MAFKKRFFGLNGFRNKNDKTSRTKDPHDQKKYHHLARRMPPELRHLRCPVCREDFKAPEAQMAIQCPEPGCNMYYHDWGNGQTCWDTIERCARPGCRGKDREKARSKKAKDKQTIMYFAKKLRNGDELTEDEMALMAQLIKDYPDIELSPTILKKVINYMKRESRRI